MRRTSLGILMTVLIWVILILNLLAFKHHWYWQYDWFDMPMHFLGGLWLGGAITWLLMKGDVLPCGRHLACVMTIILGAFTIGILWEVFEYGLDTFIMFKMNDVTDTLSDLLMDFLGTTAAYGMFAFRTANQLPVISSFEEPKL